MKEMVIEMDLERYFQKSELIPAIVVEKKNKEVLMLAYMNKESLQKTLETGYTWFYSRSRQELWNKGATSGHLQKVVSITADTPVATSVFANRQYNGQPLDYWFVLPFTLQIKGYFFIPALCFKGGDDLCHHLSSRYI